MTWRHRLRILGHPVEPPTWEITLLTPPVGFSSERGAPQFLIGQPIVAELRAPSSGSLAMLSLATGSNLYTTSVQGEGDPALAYAEIRVAHGGEAALRISEEGEATLDFEIVSGEDLKRLAAEVATRPRLTLQLGVRHFSAGKFEVCKIDDSFRFERPRSNRGR